MKNDFKFSLVIQNDAFVDLANSPYFFECKKVMSPFFDEPKSFISFIFAVFLLSHYQTIIFDRSIFGKSIILFILVNFILQIYFSNKGKFDFFK